MVSINSSSSSVVIIDGDHSGTTRPAGPQSVGLELNARKTGLASDKVKVDLSTLTDSTSSAPGAHSVSIKTMSTVGKASKVDKHKIEVGIGDWMGNAKDGDDIEFLICISGARGIPRKAPLLTGKEAKDLDVRFDLDLKGLTLNAKLKPAFAKDLKLVKCLDAEGKLAWGYLGTVDDTDKLIKMSFNSPKTGEKVAELAIDIQNLHPAGDHFDL